MSALQNATTVSQCKMLKAHLLSGHKITPLEMLDRFGILRASGRVWNLRQAGLPIVTEMVTLPNGKRVARYSLPFDYLAEQKAMA